MRILSRLSVTAPVEQRLTDIAGTDADKAADENEGDGLGISEEEDEEQEEVEQSAVTFGEHAFQFEKFEQVRIEGSSDQSREQLT